MSIWIDASEVEIPEALQAAVGGHPLVAQTLVRRGCTTLAEAQAFLDPERYTPSPPGDLPGLAAAADRLEAALRAGERILVWGDFDVDGQTATAVLVSALRSLGGQVDYHIPVRATESHGIRRNVLQKYLESGTDLVLTCDTGISAHDALAYAQEAGVTVIVTDHHELPDTLPPAAAWVNPRLLKQPNSPLQGLPGVGVAYKLVEELFLRQNRPEECEPLLDLTALGIVADLAPLTGDTRNLLQHGLNVLRSAARPGLRALYELAELNAPSLTEEHIAFSIAPRLNAIGRLGDANPAVEFLLSNDLTRVQLQAMKLESYNSRRKLLTNQVFQAAVAQLEQDPSLQAGAALVLAHPAWPAGVLGIVASRLVERYHKPVVLLANPQGAPARGSARSVPGVNITTAIASQKEYLLSFGGHPMAAGLALPADAIPDLRRGLSRQVQEQLDHLPGPAGLIIDGCLPLSALSLDLAADLERLAPFGAGNPALTLVAPRLRLNSRVSIGREQEHLALHLEDEAGQIHRVLWWGGAQQGPAAVPEGLFDLAYTARTSTFTGQRAVQIEWIDFRVLPDTVLELASAARSRQVTDLRACAAPLAELRKLQGEGPILVWGEAEARERISAQDRTELVGAERLAVWTTPPGPRELQAALDTVQPLHVYLFAVNPETSRPNQFLKRLSGLAKHVLQSRGGSIRLKELAAATAQREATVRQGLAWLDGRGYVCLVKITQATAHLEPGNGQQKPGLDLLSSQLYRLLEETDAYRQYYCSASPDSLVRE